MVLLGWHYVRRIDIDNTSNASTLTDYQILVVIDTQAIIAEGKMNADGSDIRFTDEDETTIIPHWIEDGTINTTATRIWVKVPSIPANSVKSIYMYYGNSTAENTSSIDDTMIFGDDFIGTTLNTTKWTVTNGVATLTGNGELKLEEAADGSEGEVIATLQNPNYPKGKVYEVRYQRIFGSDYAIPKFFFVSYDNTTLTTNNSLYFFANSYTNNEQNWVVKVVDGNAEYVIQADGTRDEDWHIATLIFKQDGTLELYIDGALQGSATITDAVFDTAYNYVRLRLSGYGSVYALFDYNYIRQHTDPEPTITVNAEEETGFSASLSDSFTVNEDVKLDIFIKKEDSLSITEDIKIDLETEWITYNFINLITNKIKDFVLNNFNYVAVGRSDDNLGSNNTGLEDEVFRKYVKTLEWLPDQNAVRVVAYFNTLEANDVLKEAGIFNILSDGDMYVRDVFPELNKTYDLEVEIEWIIKFEVMEEKG